MKIRIDHHVFGKLPKSDFSTLVCTAELSKDEIKKLERFSNYNLPINLWDENKHKPEKYIFYKLNDTKIIIGRGIDIGKDEFNRWGNFLFHNLILDMNEFCKLKTTPVKLTKIFEEKNIFINEINEFSKLSTSTVELDFKESETDILILSEFGISKEFLAFLLHLCLNNYYVIEFPLWVYGSKEKILLFFDFLYTILPISRWRNISYNTFWCYNDEPLPGIQFVCTSLENSQETPSKYIAKLNLYEKVFEKSKNIQPFYPDDYEVLFAESVARGQKSDIQTLKKIHETVAHSNWGTFVGLLRKIGVEEIYNISYKHWQREIINEIKKGNTELFSFFKRFLSDNEKREIFTSEDFMKIVYNSPEIQEDFINWFIGDSSQFENRRRLYPYIFQNQLIYQNLKSKLVETKTSKSIDIISELLLEYLSSKNIDKDEVLELLYVLNENLNGPEIVLKRNMFLKLLDKVKIENPDVQLMKAIIRYRIGEPKELLSFIKDKNNFNLCYNILISGFNELYKKNNLSK